MIGSNRKIQRADKLITTIQLLEKPDGSDRYQITLQQNLQQSTEPTEFLVTKITKRKSTIKIKQKITQSITTRNYPMDGRKRKI